MEQILGWELHQEINYADGQPVEFWLPPDYAPTANDCYPHPTCDHMLVWMHVNCPTYWEFGGRPSMFWVQVGYSLRPNIMDCETLLQALELAVRYVDEFREDLHQ